ncbi:MAG: hypothetical protein JW781_09750 [Deltaproteobacteria bacterium]|nr:hypothetical protein [Candidatus Anaeroferrophillacea bacterium]
MRCRRLFSFVPLLPAVLACGFVALVPPAPAAAPPVAVVLYLAGAEPHEELVAILERSLDGVAAIVRRPLAEGGTATVVDEIRAAGPCHLVAAGNLALNVALQAKLSGGGTAVFISDQQLRDAAATAGGWQVFGFTPTAAEQFSVLRSTLPGRRRFGLMHLPEDAVRVADCRRAAARHGIDLQSLAVADQRRVLPAIEQLFRESDALFMFPSPGLINRITLRQMLQYQTRLRKPMVGFAPQFVSWGAFCAVTHDSGSLEQGIAARVRAAAAGTDLPEVVPALAVYVNRRVARLLNIVPGQLPGVVQKWVE